ncbi:MAG: nucleotidyltransferase domain-containing protein [Candidatus Schekmanbacteria bacterium]|nr:nucleotidyltransferase domain-containing protein [Candidatus Schekmanbacteria bacterium]
MAFETDSIIKIAKRYIKELEKNNIRITEAIIFGSYAKGTAKAESDIDIALVSESFSGNRFDDRRRIVPLRRKIDTRIEPLPFRPEDFYNGGMMAEEIKRTGKKILKK